jgi:hypothetical protein
VKKNRERDADGIVERGDGGKVAEHVLDVTKMMIGTGRIGVGIPENALERRRQRER